MLESVDGKGITKVNLSSGSTANTPINKVKPMAVTSPSRPPPAPPGDKQKSSNGSTSNKTGSTNGHGVGSANSGNKMNGHKTANSIGVSFKNGQDKVAVVSPRRAAPVAPNKSVSQSVQNYNKKAEYPHQLKSV